MLLHPESLPNKTVKKYLTQEHRVGSACRATFPDALLTRWTESEIYQCKDETFMKRVSLCDIMEPCFYEPPNWIILFHVQLSNTELLNLGKCKLLPSDESLGVAFFLSEWDFGAFRSF